MNEAAVAIVGGGLAGAALHVRLSRAGIEAVLFERANEPRWRACGVFSSPLSRHRLRELGLTDANLARLARPIGALNLRTTRGAACRLEYSTAAGYACGFDRPALDAALLDLARRAGGVVRTGSVVTSVSVPGHRGEPATLNVSTTAHGQHGDPGESWQARVVVGADGPGSLVGRAAGVAAGARWLRRAGITFHEWGSPAQHRASDQPATVEFTLGNGWYVGVAPVPGNRVNVGIVVPAVELASGPESVVARVRGPAGAGKISDAIKVALPLRHKVSRAAGAGFVLVGDACGFIDPVTGEGIHRALVSSAMAATAIRRYLAGQSGAMDDYDRRVRARFRTKDAVSWVLQGFLAQPALLNHAVRKLGGRHEQRDVLTLVLTDQLPASRALDPRFLARLLRP